MLRKFVGLIYGKRSPKATTAKRKHVARIAMRGEAQHSSVDVKNKLQETKSVVHRGGGSNTRHLLSLLTGAGCIVLTNAKRIGFFTNNGLYSYVAEGESLNSVRFSMKVSPCNFTITSSLAPNMFIWDLPRGYILGPVKFFTAEGTHHLSPDFTCLQEYLLASTFNFDKVLGGVLLGCFSFGVIVALIFELVHCFRQNERLEAVVPAIAAVPPVFSEAKEEINPNEERYNKLLHQIAFIKTQLESKEIEINEQLLVTSENLLTMIKNSFDDAITHEIVSDPRTVRSGMTYSKSSIATWLQSQQKDPVTRDYLPRELPKPCIAINNNLNDLFKECERLLRIIESQLAPFSDELAQEQSQLTRRARR